MQKLSKFKCLSINELKNPLNWSNDALLTLTKVRNPYKIRIYFFGIILECFLNDFKSLEV